MGILGGRLGGLLVLPRMRDSVPSTEAMRKRHGPDEEARQQSP